MLARGKSLEEVLEAMGMVVEGVKTTRSARELALQYRVEMPITEQLNQVLFHGKDPGQAVNDLMERGRTEEMGELDSAFSSTWLS